MRWNDDDVHFVLDQHAKLDFYREEATVTTFIVLTITPPMRFLLFRVYGNILSSVSIAGTV